MLRIAFIFLLSACAWSESPDRWKDVRFLIGEWTGAGGGDSTGHGAGTYTFLPELDGKVLVRRSSSDYPAANGRPAIHHEDVMTVYFDRDGGPPEAIYFDNEGHVIRYGIVIIPDTKTVRFISPAQSGAPSYRLTYHETAKDVVAGQFEVAPPGKPESFTKYLEWSALRKK